MYILALDIGKRRTGVAFGDDQKQFVMALDTIRHTKEADLINAIAVIIEKRQVKRLIIGLPLLPDGSQGEQARYVQNIATQLQAKTSLVIEFIDERYTSFVNEAQRGADPDAASACAILSMALERK